MSHIIAIIDIATSLAVLAGILVVLFSEESALKKDIGFLLISLLTTTFIYIFFMIFKWLGITHSLEVVEDIVGAIIPFMWAFMLYSLTKHEIYHELAVNKEHLRITLRSIGDAVIVTDLEGRIISMNPAAETLTCCSSSEVTGKKIDEAIILIGSETKQPLDNPVEKTLRSGKTEWFSNQTILVVKNKAQYYVNESVAPLYNQNKEIYGSVLVLSDMTELYKQSKKLLESEERFNFAINGTKAGVWDYKIFSDSIIHNYRFNEIMGYDLDELEHLNIETVRQLLFPDDLAKIKFLFELHVKGKIGSIECEVRLKHKNNEWIWAMARGMIVERDKQNNPIRLTGTIIDIGSQKKIENELKAQIESNLALNEEYYAQNEALSASIEKIRRINEELHEAKQRAEESDRLKSAFLANMSHEIRTPMNGIIGFSELLKDVSLPDKTRTRYADIIIDSSKQLLNIVNDILDISQLETGKVSLVYEDVNLNKLIDKLYAFFEPQATVKKIGLIADKPFTDSDCIINTDNTRLRQVLTNLLNNAMKFTFTGHIRFGYIKTDGFVEFYVEDTGIGIAPEAQEKIFEPFRQAYDNISRLYGGTGLGLTISSRLIGFLGGRIWLESKPDQGSVFHFTIPMKTGSGIPEIKTNFENFINNKTYHMVVLVVEDDEVNYLLLETVLLKKKIKVLRARSGIEAVELCKYNSNIQLVLMDIKIPEMDGYEATRKIKEDRPGLPIIAQTAYAMHEDRKKAFEAGCDDYVSKPIRKEELFRIIESYQEKE